MRNGGRYQDKRQDEEYSKAGRVHWIPGLMSQLINSLEGLRRG